MNTEIVGWGAALTTFAVEGIKIFILRYVSMDDDQRTFVINGLAGILAFVFAYVLNTLTLGHDFQGLDVLIPQAIAIFGLAKVGNDGIKRLYYSKENAKRSTPG